MGIDEQLEQIRRGADEILVESELVEKLKQGKPLRNHVSLVFAALNQRLFVRTNTWSCYC